MSKRPITTRRARRESTRMTLDEIVIAIIGLAIAGLVKGATGIGFSSMMMVTAFTEAPPG